MGQRVITQTMDQHIALAGIEQTQKVGHRVLNVRWVPLIVNRADQSGDQAYLQVGATQRQGAEIGGQGTTVKRGTDRKSANGGKTQLGWDRIVRGRSRLGFLRSVIGVIQIISNG